MTIAIALFITHLIVTPCFSLPSPFAFNFLMAHTKQSAKMSTSGKAKHVKLNQAAKDAAAIPIPAQPQIDYAMQALESRVSIYYL